MRTASRLMAAGGTICWTLGLSVKPVSANDVQATPWRIEQVGAAGQAACVATATFQQFPDHLYETRWRLELRSDGKAVLHTTITDGLAPRYMPKKPETEDVRNRRVWFDNQAPLGVKTRIAGLAYWDVEFDSGQKLLEALPASKTMTLEYEPSAEGLGEFGQQASAPAITMEYSLAQTDDLAAELRRCLTTSKARGVYEARTIATKGPLETRTTPLPARLEAAERVVKEADRQNSDDLAVDLIRLGLLQAQAYRLEEARQTLQRGLQLGPPEKLPATLRLQAQTGLVGALIKLERLEEAAANAQGLPEVRRWQAALDVSRGHSDQGRNAFLTLIGEQAGARLNSVEQLQEWLDQLASYTSTETIERVQSLLLEWAEAALGQEEWTAHEELHGRDRAYGIATAMLAQLAAKGVASTNLRPEDGSTPTSPSKLARIAFLRGESLRRAGRLATAETDLRIADLETALGGLEAENARVRLALLNLDSDRGRDGPDLIARVERTRRTIETNYTRRSLLWLEASGLLVELRLRAGDVAAGRAAAAEVMAVSREVLPERHSLSIRLGGLSARAAFMAGNAVDAGAMAIKAAGIGPVRTITAGQLAALVDNRQVFGDRAARLTALRLLLSVDSTAQSGPAVGRIERMKLEDFLVKLTGAYREFDGFPTCRAVAMLLATERELAEEEAHKAKGLSEPDYHESDLGFALGKVGRVAQEVRVPPLAPFQLRKQVGHWLAPDASIPEDYRPAIRAGDETLGLQVLLHELHRLFDNEKSQNARRVELFDLALQLSAAASRSGASESVFARVLPFMRGTLGDSVGYSEDAKEAVSTALYERRLRAAADQGLQGASRNTSEATIAPIRHSYLKALTMSQQAEDLLATAFGGDRMFSFMMAKEYGLWGVTAKSLQVQLREGEAVVSWLPLETSTTVLVMTKSALFWHDVPQGRAELRSRINRIKSAIDRALRSDRPTLADFPAEEARKLYGTLFEKLSDDLRGIKHIYTAQLGVVGALPLRLLLTDDGSDTTALSWLGDRFQVTRMPGLINAALLGERSPANRPERSLLAIGAPASPFQRPGQESSGGMTLPSLKYASQEIDTVAALLRDPKRPSIVLKGEKAVRTAVVRELSGARYNVIMFATHGLVGGEDAGVGEPSLVLAKPREETWFDDGLLHASDVANLDVSAELVILSACSTAASGDDEGEPLTGLVSAFIAAGARQVVATYWRLDDGTAADLTRELLQGSRPDRTDVSAALQKAMAKIRGSNPAAGSYGHPIYWAPFEVIGFPSQESSKRQVAMVGPSRSREMISRDPPATTPVPLDARTSRLVNDGFEAASRGDCALLASKIKELGTLVPPRVLRGEVQGTRQQAQTLNAFADLFLKERDCRIREQAAAALRGQQDTQPRAATPRGSQSPPPNSQPPLAPSGPSVAERSAPPKLPPPDSRSEDLVARLQTELRRVGCYQGPIDGDWGALSKDALRRFNMYAGTQLAEVAGTEALNATASKRGRVCPALADVPRNRPDPPRANPPNFATGRTAPPSGRNCIKSIGTTYCE